MANTRTDRRRTTRSGLPQPWARTMRRLGVVIGLYLIITVTGLTWILSTGFHAMAHILWAVLTAVVVITSALFAVLWSIIRHDLWLPLQYQAEHDDLTGLRRPASFWAACAQQVAVAIRGQYALAFVFVDLDNFKAINDQHGHAVGDAVLQAAGRVFLEAARSTDILGRLGGEEFGWVLPGATAREAALATERVLEGWRSLTIAGLTGLTFSAGVASMTGQEAVALSAWDLARAADRALYQAKASGKARVALAERAS